MTKPLISIIIPTYNRASLLGATLDSISAQTYVNWECIIVDDGSTDGSKDLIMAYALKDSRFKFYSRPSNLIKGANSCRNYGSDKSSGEFVNWFDSDDLMFPENLRSKMDSFTPNLDFVVGNSLNFDEDGKNSRPYKLDYDIPITPENFITGKIGWITDDVLIRKNCLVIRFNENLKSGQEYNFFSRLLYFTQRGKYIREDLCFRRIHKASIHKSTKNIKSQALHGLIENEVHLLNDLGNFASSKIINRSLKRIIRFSFESSNGYKIDRFQLKVWRTLILKNKYISSLYYAFWIISNSFSSSGYVFIKKAVSCL